MKKIWYQYALLVALSIIDFIITYKYLNIVGVFGELNPIMRWVTEVVGSSWGIIYLKMIVLAWVAFSLWYIQKSELIASMAPYMLQDQIIKDEKELKRTYFYLKVANVMMVCVCIWGYHVLSRVL